MKYMKILIMMSLVLIAACNKTEKVDSANQATTEKKVYTCPMHPQIISDKPGVCPICQMELVLKTSDHNMTKEEMDKMLTFGDGKLILANVKTVVVERENLSKEIKAFGYLDFAEQNKRTITARFNGRIEKLFVNKTGDYVKQGTPLFEIYSPDLVQAQNEYLIALKSNQTSLIPSAEKKLQIMGITQKQIDELKSTKEVKLTLTYYSPYSGIVIEKKIQEGSYVNEGVALFEIADLSTVWDIAEVFADDISSIKIGGEVSMRLQSFPGEIFHGKVDFIYPVVNAQTRTIKVRSLFSNSQNKLKPNMYTENYFSSKAGAGLVVNADAVLMTGQRNIVWVEVEKGKFEMREVKLGMRINDKYQILSGLKQGELVAASGGYLIDSESQLRTGAPSGHQHNLGATSDNNSDLANHVNQTSEEKKMDMKNPANNSVSGNSIIREGLIDLESIDKNKDGKVFQDQMDWNVISDKPGKCPLCKMTLIEVAVKKAKDNLIKNGYKVK